MADQKKKNEGNTTPKSQSGAASTEKKGQKTAKSPQKKRKEPRYTGWRRVAYYVYIALTILSAFIVVGGIAFHFFSAPPKIEPPQRTYSPDDPVVVSPDPNDPGPDPERPSLSAERKKEFYTFLVVGQDQTGNAGGGGNTDTMMLVAYDVPNQKLSVMSLPRDTYVRYRGSTVLLNSIYSRGGAGENGIQKLKEEVEELTGIYPDFYVMIQWEALGELVDAIDGVEFKVPYRMYYNDLSQHFKIDLQEGLQTLNGSQAMQLIRWRMNSIGDTGKIDYHYGYADGDLGRIRTQQDFMKAIIKKCLQPEVLLSNLGKFINVFQENVTTDLTAGNMAYFAKNAIGKLDMDDVTMLTMPNTYAGEHVVPLGGDLVKAINEHFNPYQSDIRLSQLDLVTQQDAADSTSTTSKQNNNEEPKNTAVPTESPKPSSSAQPDTSNSSGQKENEQQPSGDAEAQPVNGQPTEHDKPSEDNKPAANDKSSGSEKPAESDQTSAGDKPSESNQPKPSTNPGTNPASNPADDEPVLPPDSTG